MVDVVPAHATEELLALFLHVMNRLGESVDALR